MHYQITSCWRLCPTWQTPLQWKDLWVGVHLFQEHALGIVAHTYIVGKRHQGVEHILGHLIGGQLVYFFGKLVHQDYQQGLGPRLGDLVTGLDRGTVFVEGIP